MGVWPAFQCKYCGRIKGTESRVVCECCKKEESYDVWNTWTQEKIDEFREDEPIWPCVCPDCRGKHNQEWSKLDFLIDNLVGIRDQGDSVRHSLDITMVLLGYLRESIGGYQSFGEKAKEIESLLGSLETDIDWSLDHHRNDMVP